MICSRKGKGLKLKEDRAKWEACMWQTSKIQTEVWREEQDKESRQHLTQTSCLWLSLSNHLESLAEEDLGMHAPLAVVDQTLGLATLQVTGGVVEGEEVRWVHSELEKCWKTPVEERHKDVAKHGGMTQE